MGDFKWRRSYFTGYGCKFPSIFNLGWGIRKATNTIERYGEEKKGWTCKDDRKGKSCPQKMSGSPGQREKVGLIDICKYCFVFVMIISLHVH